MENSKRYLVLHRNRLFRDSLSSYLSAAVGHEVASLNHLNGTPVIGLIEEPAALILLDLKLPDDLAIEVTKVAAQLPSPPKILLLVPEEHGRLMDAIAAGVHGCVLEQSSLDELESAIERVLAGEIFCSPELVTTMFRAIAKTMNPVDRKVLYQPHTKRLTIREIEVLELLNRRKSNKEIAVELSVSLFTVKNHVRNILEKLNAENRMEAVDLARQQRTLEPPRNAPGR